MEPLFPISDIQETKEDRRPGSPDAIRAGCKCPATANHYGHGYAFVSRERGHKHDEWVVSTACRMHWNG